MPLAADVWSASTSLTRLYTASGKVHIFSAIILLPLAVVKLNLTVLGPVVQRPISSNPGLNFNPAFFISLFKSLLGKIFTILFRTSNDQIASKKI